MPLASVTSFVAGLLDGMTWPAGMQALTSPPPPLVSTVIPTSPTVSAGPAAYVWFGRVRESRANAEYSAGTIPRGYGTKTQNHGILIYVVWTGGSPSDPNAAILFPGMVDAIMANLRTTSLPSSGVPVTDPWTGAVTNVVDIGEVQSVDTYLRELEPMQLQRLDALIEAQVVEVMTA
jgi:hypothetical protein